MTESTPDIISQRYQEIQALSPTADSAQAVPEGPTISVSSFLSLSLFIFFFVVVFLGFLPLVIGRFRDFKRFQMAMIMAFLAGALPLTVGLVLHQSGILTKADIEEAPRHIKIVEVAPTSFRIRWETAGFQYGALRYGVKPASTALTRTVLEVGGLTRSTEHDLIVSDLVPETDYYFELLSGAHWYDSNWLCLTVQALPK